MLGLLRATIPVGYPVWLVRSIEEDEWGWSNWDEEREGYLLGVHPEAGVETVVHEYAHIMVWDACVESDHDAMWGVAYARAYRAGFER